VKQTHEAKPATLYLRVTAIEEQMLRQRIESLFDNVAELCNAMCNAEHDLIVDTAGLRVYARAAIVNAAQINSMMMRAQLEAGKLEPAPATADVPIPGTPRGT